MENGKLETTDWSKNVILVDADWLDKVVFDMTVNFERMLMRPMPKADLAKWIDFVALDGGLRPGDNKVQVLLLHDNTTGNLKNCAPADFATELDAKAFSDNLGEFLFSSVAVEPTMVNKGGLFCQSLDALLSEDRVERLMLVADTENYGQELKGILNKGKRKDTTLFTLEPLAGYHNCSCEILTYSLLATLGIKSSEILH